MTTQEEIETQEPEPTPEAIPYYVIDPSRLEELNRSLATLLLSRRCPSCRARIEAEGESPSPEEHMKQIAKCCGNQEGFIRPEMPMQDIVFRTILSGGNKPVSLTQLHYLITDQWYTPLNPRNISEKGLKLVLNSDAYYGFKEILETPAGE